MIDWSRQFPVVCINRADLNEFGFTDEQIATLFPDEVMQQIADEMQTSSHLHQPFWSDFGTAIKTVLGFEVQGKGELAMSDWSTPFPIGSVYRFDLQRIVFLLM